MSFSIRTVGLVIGFLGWVIPCKADTTIPCCSTSLDATERLLLVPDMNGADPHPMASFTVTVRNEDCVPIANATVQVTIGGLVDGRTRLCGVSVTTGTTNSLGEVRMNIAGGGCYRGQSAVSIRANGVEIRNFGAVLSPDYAGWDNDGIAGRSDLRVTVLDFASFAQAFHVGGPSCHDYNNNQNMDASDFSVFGQIWSGGTRGCDP